MNMLNSLIIEGNMVEDSLTKDSFKVRSTRTIRSTNGECAIVCYEFKVLMHGIIAKSVHEQWKSDRGIRIVGALVNRGKSTCILAEHIEYKPKKAVKDATNCKRYT